MAGLETEDRSSGDLAPLVAAVSSAIDAEDFGKLRAAIADQHPADIASTLEGLTPAHRRMLWGEVDGAIKGEVLIELPDTVRADLVRVMSGGDLVAAARALDTDDIADLLPDLSDDVIAEILHALDKQDRQRLDAVLSFREDTAGGLMNVDVVTVRENITLEVVLRYLRMRGELPENTNQLFVVDRNDRLLGALPVERLLTSDPEVRVSQAMEHDARRFQADAEDTEVAAAFERYNLVSAPVVDDEGHLLGRITVDDVVDVIVSEADRAVMARAGLSEDEDILAPVMRASRNRAVWLGVNLITAILASVVIGFFEHTIEQVVAVAVLMPIVTSMGGNAGLQTVTLVVRGLALGIVSEANARKVLIKELLVGVTNGLLFAVVVGAVAVSWYGQAVLGWLIAVSMAVNLVVAAGSGAAIPLLIRRFGVDPALASGPILTTVTDVVGFFVFLGLATIFLV